MAAPPVIRVDGASFEAGGKRILADVSVTFKPGELAAILGPSGCGKTTLLKLAAAINRPTKGSVTVGGREVWDVREEYRRRLGYVPQDDIVHRELTVEQAYRFSALLRLDDAVPAADLERRIDVVAKALGLDERRGLRIAKLSGGQRKRVNIGIELLADPDVLLLDEPASGLDPGTEADLVDLLQRLAKQGRTVVLTTHSMEQLAKLDRIVVMADGRLMFDGKLPDLLAHFRVSHPADIFTQLRKKI